MGGFALDLVILAGLVLGLVAQLIGVTRLGYERVDQRDRCRGWRTYGGANGSAE
jgi:hypothetical protein